MFAWSVMLLYTFNVAKGHLELISTELVQKLPLMCGSSSPVRSSGDPTMDHVILKYTVD